MSTDYDDDHEAWKRRRMIERAFEMADTGRHEDFTDIAYALQFERGIASVPSLIDDAAMRRALNERCATARDALKERAPAPVADEAHPSLFQRVAMFLRRSTARSAELGSAAS